MDPASLAHPHGHLVAEPAVVEGYTGYRLHEVAALFAHGVQHFELLPHQAAPAVVGVGADQLRQPGVELHPLVGEALPDQARRGDDGASTGVLDDGEVSGPAGGMFPAHQVARHGGYPPIGFAPPEGPARGVVHPRVESGHGLDIGGGRPA